jgi:hypothetical protein
MDNYNRFCQEVMDELFNCQRGQFYAHPPGCQTI